MLPGLRCSQSQKTVLNVATKGKKWTGIPLGITIFCHVSLVFQCVICTTIRTLGFARFFNRQIHSRVRIPQAHAVHRTVQWQIGTTHFVVILRIGLNFSTTLYLTHIFFPFDKVYRGIPVAFEILFFVCVIFMSRSDEIASNDLTIARNFNAAME